MMYWPIILILTSFIAHINGQPFCIEDSNQLTCNGFDSFDQLDFKSGQQYSTVIIEPKTSLILDKKLNLNGLILISNNNPPKIVLTNLAGFDPLYNPFHSIQFVNNDQNLFDLEIRDSIWNYEPKIECEWRTDNQDKGPKTFNGLNINMLFIRFPTFTAPLCPVMFANTRIEHMLIQELATKITFEKIDSDLSDQQTLTESLNITVNSLEAKFVFDEILKRLNTDTLLNEYLFSRIERLLLEFTEIEAIDESTFQNFHQLKSLRIGVDNLEQLFNNSGLSWMSYLNPEKKEPFLFEMSFSFTLNTFIFDDTNICLLKYLPTSDKAVLFMFDLRSNSPNYDYILPCSCPIYWIYSGFSQSDILASPNRAKLPVHCFNVSQLVLEDQINYCQNEIKINQCKGTTTQGVTTTSILTTSPRNCNLSQIDPENEKCTCSYEANMNILQCDNLTRPLTDFSSSVPFDYVNLMDIGGHLSTNSFPNLNLAPYASLILSNIDTFDDNVFRDINYTDQFRLVLINSSMDSLSFAEPFAFTNFSVLELQECSFGNRMSAGAFNGARVDTLIINKVRSDSLVFSFRPSFTPNPPSIRRLRILDIYDTFKKNPNVEIFGLDSFFMNQIVFQDLEEIEIRNTWLEYLDEGAFFGLNNLKVVRLENVHLFDVIQRFYQFTLLMGYVPENNWIYGVQKVYMGHEFDQRFKFEDEFLCYFLNQKSETSVFIYDSLDSEDGLECTCTIYWIYQNYQFENSSAYGDDLKYVPQCIKKLNNTDNLEARLNECLNSKESTRFCKDLLIGTSQATTDQDETSSMPTVSTSTSTSTTTSTTSTTTITKTTTPLEIVTVNTHSEQLEEILSLKKVLIGITSAILGVMVVGILLILFIYSRKKRKDTVRAVASSSSSLSSSNATGVNKRQAFQESNNQHVELHTF